ncbi:MAG: hypothetical protein NVSMB17_19950 [Candidatus Dormibacteria bacterium]
MPAPLGRVLFFDDFEATPVGLTIPGWTVAPPPLAAPTTTPSPTPTPYFAIIEELGPHHRILSVPGVERPIATAKASVGTDYQVSADVKTNPVDGHAWLIARVENSGKYYACGLSHGEGGLPAKLFLGKSWDGYVYSFDTAPFAFDLASWYHVEFAVKGNDLYCQVTDPVTGKRTILQDTKTYFTAAGLGAGVTGEKAYFDNFQVNAL